MSLPTCTEDKMADGAKEITKDMDVKKDVSPRRPSISSEMTGFSVPPPPYQQSQSTQGFQNPVPDLPITPTTVFTVQAKGTRFFRLPTPSGELEIAIFNGTDTTREPVYKSCRPKRSSGSAILRHFVKGELLATNYRFGPFREPEIVRVDNCADGKLVQNDQSAPLAVKINTGMRDVSFTSVTDESKTFTWEYKKAMTAFGKRKVILLSMRDSSPMSEWKKDKLLAALVRTEDTRTPGTRKSDAGNGGLLVLDEDATRLMNEETIVATCLMMLKKEIDRQRMVQIALISGGGGG